MAKFTKNKKKRIDPRYFLNETVDRDKLEEERGLGAMVKHTPLVKGSRERVTSAGHLKRTSETTPHLNPSVTPARPGGANPGAGIDWSNTEAWSDADFAAQGEVGVFSKMDPETQQTWMDEAGRRGFFGGPQRVGGEPSREMGHMTDLALSDEGAQAEMSVPKGKVPDVTDIQKQIAIDAERDMGLSAGSGLPKHRMERAAAKIAKPLRSRETAGPAPGTETSGEVSSKLKRAREEQGKDPETGQSLEEASMDPLRKIVYETITKVLNERNN